MCVCVCARACVHTYMCMHAHAEKYYMGCMYFCMYVYLGQKISACVFIYVPYTRLIIYVYIYLCTYTYIHEHRTLIPLPGLPWQL